MSEIPQDLASKVISADLRNLVKKVSEGSSLTQAEREMMERAVIDGTLPEELHEARLAALARAYAMGKALTPGQQKELSAIIPQGKPIAKKLTRESYRYRLPHYVSILGVDKDEDGKPAKDPERKLKRWLAAGREKTPPDMPPFDAPHLMAEWWRRCMKIRVPTYLLALENTEEAAPPKADASSQAEKSETSAPDGEVAGVPMMFEGGSEMTADIGLNQIRELVVTLHKRMKSSFEAGRLTEASGYMRQWEKAVGMLRQWEKDIVKIQEGKGEVLRTRVINTEVGRILTVMSQSFFNSLQAVLDTHASAIPAPERRKLALGYKDKCFAHLKSTRFAAVYQPEPAEAA